MLFFELYIQSNQHIRMIFEGSRDTEDWSNDAEKIYYNRKLLFKL